MGNAPVTGIQTLAIPSSLQLEVLGFLVKDREVMSRYAEIITDKHFENPIHRIIYTIARKHYRKYSRLCSKRIMEVELNSWLRKNSKKQPVPATMFWSEMERIFSIRVVQREYFIDKIGQYLIRYKLAVISEEAARIVQDEGPVEMDRLTHDINTLYAAMAGGGDNMEFLLKDAESRVRDLPQMSKVETGLLKLDGCLGGGLETGELGVILAPTGWGKSFFLVTVGAGALIRRKKVLHFTLELKREKVIARYESYLSKVEKKMLADESAEVSRTLTRIRNLSAPGEVLVIEYPTKSLTIDEMRAKVSQVSVGLDFRPDLIICDYADILRPTVMDRSEKRYEVLMSLYERLRGLAQEFDVPIWTGSQANKASMSKKFVTIQDMAESFGKAQVADVVVGICMTKEEIESNRGRLYLTKNRDNESHFVIHFKRDFDRSRFEEIEEIDVQHLAPGSVFYQSGNEVEEDPDGIYDE
jgi:replicative DNA helicase